MLKVVQIPGKSRGVILNQVVHKNQLLEASPTCCMIPVEHRKLLDDTVLFEYYFVQQSEYSHQKESVNGYIVFGLTSLCNHSDQPNAEIKWVHTKDGVWVHLVSLKMITAGEEVTISYANIDQYPELN